MIKGYFKVLGLILILTIGVIGVIMPVKFLTNTANVVAEEFSPNVLLEKYAYFKDVHAQLEAKQESIGVLLANISALEIDYPDPVSRPRDVRQDITLSRTELAGLKLSFNTLAGEYNAAMAKFNYAFCNVGTLPKGATNPLPREYVLYINQ